MSTFVRKASKIIDWLSRSHRAVLLTYIGYGIAARAIGLFRSVINWDETTYLLGGRALTQGKELYIDFWDFKPPGIFWITAGIETLFDDGIFWFRVLAMLSVIATGYVLYRLSLRANPRERMAAFFAGLFFISAISFQSLSFGIGKGSGLEANTEHFFIFFAVLGAWFLFDPKRTPVSGLLGGLALGAGFLIKYFVAFDMLALGVILIGLHWQEHQLKKIGRLLLRGILYTVGCLLPFALLNGWYFFYSGNWDVWVNITYESGSGYASLDQTTQWGKYFQTVGDVFYITGIVGACVVGLLISWFRKKGKKKAPNLRWWLLWWLVTLVGAMLPGKWFTHYLYQCFPAFCLLAGSFLAVGVVNRFRSVFLRGAIVGSIMLVSLPVFNTMKWVFFFSKPDHPREIAAWLDDNTTPEQPIYCFSYFHAVLYLTDRLPPTKYYHPSLLWREDHIAANGVDLAAEIKHIFDQNPPYVLYRIQEFHSPPYATRIWGVRFEPDTIIDDCAILIMDRHPTWREDKKKVLRDFRRTLESHSSALIQQATEPPSGSVPG